MSETTKTTNDDAVVAEATEVETIDFEYDGQKYTVERDCADDAIVYEALERDHYATVVSRILGPAQWRLFNLKRRRASDLIEVSNVIFTAVADGNLGESKG